MLYQFPAQYGYEKMHKPVECKSHGPGACSIESVRKVEDTVKPPAYLWEDRL